MIAQPCGVSHSISTEAFFIVYLVGIEDSQRSGMNKVNLFKSNGRKVIWVDTVDGDQRYTRPFNTTIPSNRATGRFFQPLSTIKVEQ
jgi:hypothetical protein